MRLIRERSFLILLLFLFAFAGAASMTFGPRTRWVPAGCAVLGGALCLALLAGKEDATASGRSGAWRAAAVLLVVAGAGILGGMLAAAPAAYIGFALFCPEGRRWRQVIAASLVSTLLVYVLFGIVLEIPLLRGLP